MDIPVRTWHQGCNDTDEPAHIIEIWKGPSELLTEDDIERFNEIGIIGASSFLGRYMTDYLDAYAIPGRFGWQENRWMEDCRKI